MWTLISLSLALWRCVWVWVWAFSSFMRLLFGLDAFSHSIFKWMQNDGKIKVETRVENYLACSRKIYRRQLKYTMMTTKLEKFHIHIRNTFSPRFLILCAVLNFSYFTLRFTYQMLKIEWSDPDMVAIESFAQRTEFWHRHQHQYHVHTVWHR